MMHIIHTDHGAIRNGLNIYHRLDYRSAGGYIVTPWFYLYARWDKSWKRWMLNWGRKPRKQRGYELSA